MYNSRHLHTSCCLIKMESRKNTRYLIFISGMWRSAYNNMNSGYTWCTYFSSINVIPAYSQMSVGKLSQTHAPPQTVYTHFNTLSSQIQQPESAFMYC